MSSTKEVAVFGCKSTTKVLIDWQADVHQIDSHFRAATRPFKGDYAFINGEKITTHRAQVLDHENENKKFFQLNPQGGFDLPE